MCLCMQTQSEISKAPWTMHLWLYMQVSDTDFCTAYTQEGYFLTLPFVCTVQKEKMEGEFQKLIHSFMYCDTLYIYDPLIETYCCVSKMSDCYFILEILITKLGSLLYHITEEGSLGHRKMSFQKSVLLRICKCGILEGVGVVGWHRTKTGV